MIHVRLKAFHAVAKFGGFTAAAKSLGLTQPAVSLQVQALERQYNTELFVRKGRKVDLTQTGILLLNLSNRYFNLEGEIHSLLTSLMQLKSGKLRIACDIAPNVFPLTEEFRRSHPNIELSVLICKHHQIQEDLLDHLVDIALSGSKPSSNDLEYLEIGKEDISVTLSKSHPFSQKTSLSVQDLENQKLFFYLDAEDGMGGIEEALIKASNFPQKNIVTFNNKEMVLEAVAHNQGISFLSKREVQHDRRLISLPLSDYPQKRIDYVIFRKDKRDSPLISAFRNQY
ncbi:MAG: LysR substrate-binding domain-containing protein [Sneathiella sp.]